MTTDTDKPIYPTTGEEAGEPARTTGGEPPGARLQAAVSVTRRTFVKILGAGVLITVLPMSARGRRGGGRGDGQGARVGARIHIGKDGTITVMTGKVEGGQGARTELTQVAADELRLPSDRILLVMGDTSLCPDDGITAGSMTTPRTIPAVRQGAAAARTLLVARASQQWGVDAVAVAVRDGKAVHLGDAAKPPLTYADLVAGDEMAKAFEQAAPANVAVTPVKEWKVQGTSVARPNARDIVTGAHRFPSDIVRPGLLYGKVLRPPSYGAKRTAVDLAPAKAMKDVVAVEDGPFVGVAAPTLHTAEQALAAIAKTATWEAAPHPSSREVFEYLKQHARGVAKNPFADEVAKAGKALHQEYHVAYVQHSPLEPRAAVAEWEGGKLTVWTGSQNPFGCRAEIARALGLASDRVRVIVPDFGAGFGGKHTAEAGIEAARLAKAAGKPVRLRWTRVEEFTWAYFRPAAVIDIEASLDAKGSLTSWYFININSGGAAIDTPYRAGGKAKSQFVASDAPLRQGSYRALAATANNFARERFMDELASAAGADPLEFRLAHLDNPRLKAVLEAAAKRFDWAGRAKKKEPGVGVGLACGTEKGSFVAACAEVATASGQIAVRRVCQVFECGAILNPENLLSQIAGCIVMGLGPALREEMQFEKGVILTDSYATYPVPRFSDVPELDLQPLDRPDLTSVGAGETPIIAIAPAVANAVFHATGQRIRQMPIRLPKTAAP